MFTIQHPCIGLSSDLVRILITVFRSCQTNTSSRAFARDRGYPFPDTFSKVHPTLRIPVNAVLVTSSICLIINIIPVGSTVAFYAL
jgi:amino acid transporter